MMDQLSVSREKAPEVRWPGSGRFAYFAELIRLGEKDGRLPFGALVVTREAFWQDFCRSFGPRK
jgi:hypothetical protein